MYDYQMIEQLRERSQNVFDMKAARCIPCCISWNKRVT